MRFVVGCDAANVHPHGIGYLLEFFLLAGEGVVQLHLRVVGDGLWIVRF